MRADVNRTLGARVSESDLEVFRFEDGVDMASHVFESSEMDRFLSSHGGCKTHIFH